MRLPNRPVGGISVNNRNKCPKITICKPFNGRELIPCWEMSPTTEDTDEIPAA